MIEEKGINVICRSDVNLRDRTLACVAVDAGLKYAIESKLRIIQVVGDFDSLAGEDYLLFQDRHLRLSYSR